MSNIRHYIDSIRSGNEFFTLGRKSKVIIYSLGIFECILALFFLITKIYQMMVLSIIYALFYFILINRMVNENKFASAMIFTLFSITLFSFIATLCTGFETGFSAYSFGSIAACFYLSFVIEDFQKREGIPLIFSIIFVTCYIFNYVMMIFISPFYVIKNPIWIHIFHNANYFITFFIAIGFNFLFIWEIKATNSALASQNEILEEMAHMDPLTRLYNRRSMNKYLQKSMDNLKMTGKRFCLILGDIDDFKHINDTYGHDAGDAILVSVANAIKASIHEGDVVCRWGGEEILILVNESVETAYMTAERTRKNVESSITIFDNLQLQVTMTFGIAESIPGYKVENLIQQADNRLYFGKRNGKNQVVSSIPKEFM